MARPILATKLYLPRPRRGLVARPRLSERLAGGGEAKLTVVSAPAGFGKTTVLAEWLSGSPAADRRVAWLSLDPADGDPASFWSYVVAALRTAVPGLGERALELLDVSPVPAEPALTQVLNELAEVPGELWLVLDDYHLVDGPEIAAGMAFLVEHLPPQVHVVLGTRADPDLPLSRWRARGELAELRAGDLRFTADEAAAYLGQVPGLTLAPDQVAALEARTEGWIAALQLAALSIQGREDAAGFIARFAGDDRYIVDYLVEEVLAHQSGTVREFLLRSAVLERLTGPLCDAVTGDLHDADAGDADGNGNGNGNGMLAELERANLFVVPLDDRREWYRYHQLFADVLRARLLAEQPDLVPLLHQRASRWYEDHDLIEESVQHALAARDVDRAAFLMELAVPAIRRHRQEALLLGWLKILPDDVVRRSPVLSVFYGYLLMLSGDVDAVEARLDDAERALAAGPAGEAVRWADTDELRTLPATLAVHRAALAQARGDVAGTAEQARRALELAGPTDHLARGGAAGFLGLAAWAQGDVVSALETFAQAVASLHAAGNLVDGLNSTVTLADLWLAAGRPSAARRLYQEALQLAEHHGDAVASATADLLVGLSELDLEGGDAASAGRQLDRAQALGRRASRAESRYRWFVAASRVARAGGDPDRAVALLDQAEQLYRPGFLPDLRPAAAIRARVWIGQGNLSRAGDWAAERRVSLADDAGYLGEFDQLTLVRLLIARYRADPADPAGAGTLDRANGLLDRLAAGADACGRAGSLLEIRLLQALTHHVQGRRPQALRALGLAWTQAPEPEGYRQLFLDEGAPMQELLRQAEQQGLPGGHPRRLLGPGATGDGGRGAAVPTLSDRELQVLRLLDSELSGPQIAGELFVSHNTLRTHTKHIFAKLEVTSRRAAVRRARERGLI